MMQVLEQAIGKVGNLDQGKIADYIHKNEFDTFVGKVRFAQNGEWAAVPGDHDAVSQHRRKRGRTVQVSGQGHRPLPEGIPQR